jgi:glyoxylase-like metal-dependent hydrolase (beta-lactamase superfamily II)
MNARIAMKGALALLGLLAGTAMAAESLADGEIHAWKGAGQVWVLSGGPEASNTTVQIGDEGVYVVDSNTAAMAPKLVAKIKQLAAQYGGTNKNIAWVVNTGASEDHVGGNKIVREGGAQIVAGNMARDNPGLAAGAAVMSHQGVLDRLVTDNAAGLAWAAPANWPGLAYNSDLYKMPYNQEAVQLFHEPASVTDHQSLVMFRRSDVIVAGDILSALGYPHIDTSKGGSIDGELVALNHIIEKAVPAEKEEGGTLVVPGHGKVFTEYDVVLYKNMLTVIRNRVQLYKNQGKTLAQVQELKPSWDYDGRWGSDTGEWTTKRFIETIYKTLPAKGGNFAMQNQTLVLPTGKIY